jgi:hypothetical protein
VVFLSVLYFSNLVVQDPFPPPLCLALWFTLLRSGYDHLLMS